MSISKSHRNEPPQLKHALVNAMIVTAMFSVVSKFLLSEELITDDT